MHLNIFSYILIIVLLCIIIKDFNKSLETFFKHILTVGLIISFNMNLGFFVEIGTFSFGYATAINAVLAIVGITLIFSKKNYDFKVLKIGMGAIISVILGLILAKLRPYTGGIIYNYDAYVGGDLSRQYKLEVSSTNLAFVLNMAGYLIIASTVFNIYKKRDIIKLLKNIVNISIFIIFVAFTLEIIGNYVIGVSMTQQLYVPLFGYTEATSLNIDRFHGLFKEASHYSMGLFFLSILCVVNINWEKHLNHPNNVKTEMLKMFFLFFLLLTSTSFIAIFYFLVAICVYIIYNSRRKMQKICLFTAMLAIAAIAGLVITGNGNIIPKYDRFVRLFNSFVYLVNEETATFSSEGARLTSMFEMLKLVAARPLFGIGAAMADAHSTALSCLGTIGIVGSSIFLLAILKTCKISIQQGWLTFFIVFSLIFAGGIGGILEIRLLFVFMAIGCTKKWGNPLFHSYNSIKNPSSRSTIKLT